MSVLKKYWWRYLYTTLIRDLTVGTYYLIILIRNVVMYILRTWGSYSIIIWRYKWQFLAMVVFVSALFQSSKGYTMFDEIMCEILQWGYILGVLGFWFNMDIKEKKHTYEEVKDGL